MNKNFTITFWIRVANNPGWMKLDSEINFPPFTVNEGINVYFSKYEKFLKVYILHPELGYRKIVANIENYIQRDAFIALTNSEQESIIYINGNSEATIRRENIIQNLEIGDYVMVKVKTGDLPGLTVGENVEIVMPAKVKKISDNIITLLFFNQNLIADLDITRLLF